MKLLKWQIGADGDYKAETGLLGQGRSITYWVYDANGLIHADLRMGASVIEKVCSPKTIGQGVEECERHYLDIIANLPQVQGVLL